MLLLFFSNCSCQKWVYWLVGWLVFNDFWNFFVLVFCEQVFEGVFCLMGHHASWDRSAAIIVEGGERAYCCW